MTRLNLTAIRSANIHKSAEFYNYLGLNFELHRHGKGPEHYATMDTSVVFEIYPATEKMPITIGTRIGFEVDSCEEVARLLLDSGYTVKTTPSESPWGMRTVFSDPDNHSVEIVSAL